MKKCCDLARVSASPARRISLLALTLAFLGMACYWPTPAAPASNATPEVLVVVVTATGEPDAQPPAANTAAATSTSTTEPSPTNTSAPTNTPTNTLTPTPNTPMATANKGVDVNCRFGPGAEFAVSSYFLQGQTTPVLGRSQYSTWVQIQDPRTPSNKCWVDVDFVTLNVPVAGLTELPTPAGYVYDASISFSESKYGCPLPVHAKLSYTIKVSGPATVTYTLTASWPGGPFTETKIFTSFGKIQYTDRPLIIPVPEGTVTVTLTVTAPNSFTRSATTKVDCS